MRRHRRYPDGDLAEAVRASKSYAGVLRHLGLRQAGGTQAHLKRRIAKAGIDTAHFLGRASNQGPGRKGGPRRLGPGDVLVLRDPLADRIKVRVLRRAMLEAGIPHRCAECGLAQRWNGRDLVLEIDHVNGRHHDNRADNVRFLCPNCHSQTATYATRNIGRHAEVVERQTREP